MNADCGHSNWLDSVRGSVRAISSVASLRVHSWDMHCRRPAYAHRLRTSFCWCTCCCYLDGTLAWLGICVDDCRRQVGQRGHAAYVMPHSQTNTSAVQAPAGSFHLTRRVYRFYNGALEWPVPCLWSIVMRCPLLPFHDAWRCLSMWISTALSSNCDRFASLSATPRNKFLLYYSILLWM